MKKDIHPKNFALNARCICGKEFSINSTRPEVIVSFCSSCHPFYTQKQQFADMEGRIDKFKKKYKNTSYAS